MSIPSDCADNLDPASSEELFFDYLVIVRLIAAETGFYGAAMSSHPNQRAIHVQILVLMIVLSMSTCSTLIGIVPACGLFFLVSMFLYTSSSEK